MFMRRFALLILLIAGSSGAARADLIVTIGDADVAVGGPAFVDVFVRSDAILGDFLSGFGFEFRIETAGASRLEFVNPQPDPQLADARYVLFGDSLDANAGLPVGNVLLKVVPGDTFLGGDSTDSGGNVLVTTSRLLARLQVTAATALPPSLGDTFTIRLVDDPAGSNSFFSNNAGSVPFSSMSGTVTVRSVPEPSSLLLALVAAPGLAWWIRRQGRRTTGADCSFGQAL